jgi:hypothetical protein
MLELNLSPWLKIMSRGTLTFTFLF